MVYRSVSRTAKLWHYEKQRPGKDVIKQVGHVEVLVNRRLDSFTHMALGLEKKKEVME